MIWLTRKGRTQPDLMLNSRYIVSAESHYTGEGSVVWYQHGEGQTNIWVVEDPGEVYELIEGRLK